VSLPNFIINIPIILLFTLRITKNIAYHCIVNDCSPFTYFLADHAWVV